MAPLLRVAITRLSEDEALLVWTFHHVVLDGWSLAQVLGEVCEQYAAIVEGRRPELIARRPFRDYLQWLGAQDEGQAEQHWRSVLSGFDSLTPLPYDRAPVQAHRAESSETVEVVLSVEQSGLLREVAQRNGLTVNTVVQGAWALLLSRYSGERDVVFGTTVSGRPAELAGVEQMVGMFINTVPARVEVHDGQDVVSWLHGLQAGQVECRRFDFISLTQLQTWSDLPVGVNLFDSVVVFENYPFDEASIADKGLRIRDSQAVDTTSFALALYAFLDDRLAFKVAFDPDLFDPATIQRVAEHLKMLLNQIVGDAAGAVGELPMLTRAEAQRVLVEYNDTVRAVSDATLPELLEAQVARTPDTTAVLFEGAGLSYGELNAQANRLAHKLIAAGVGPERCVAVVLPRSVELVIALWAVLKAGAAYLPIDLGYPAERVAFVLDDAAPVVVLDDPYAVWDTEGFPDTNPADGDRIRVLAPLSGAYVIYTSGSTGKPKGVVVPHCGIVNRLLWTQAEYGLHADDRVLQKTPSSFDVSVWEFFWPLLVGATLVVAKPEGHKDPAYLAG
ncbi:MAG: condensation domain-containing protein, partial [Actinobacteria bacterium]|nr:condensation domain-containing protein [Actinomycetota bacterium]